MSGQSQWSVVSGQWGVVSREFGDESWEFRLLFFYELELTSAQSNLQ
jgi:hypothetical protein